MVVVLVVLLINMWYPEESVANASPAGTGVVQGVPVVAIIFTGNMCSVPSADVHDHGDSVTVHPVPPEQGVHVVCTSVGEDPDGAPVTMICQPPPRRAYPPVQVEFDGCQTPPPLT